jgi:16S rRNA (uracil1498-N3)-methyltransferase
MHRFYLPPSRCQGTTLTLDGSEAHHALHVLRVRAGDPVVVLDGSGSELACVVQSATRHEVNLEVGGRVRHPVPPVRLTLFQAVTKARSMEWIVQKAAELGCHRLVPVITARSVPQYAEDAGDRKSLRWSDLAIEAMKQCGWPWLPEITPPAPLIEVLRRGLRFDLALVASLHPGTMHPRRHIEAFEARAGRRPSEAAVWIGPEGDFTGPELAAIIQAGALPISLGPQVLRSETAAVYCLAFLNYEFQPADAPPRAWVSSQSQAEGST